MTTLVRDLPRKYLVDCDSLKTYNRLIDFTGPGWYSLGDDGTYRPGTFATYSRIRIRQSEA